MPLFLFLMTTSLIVTMANDGSQLMSLLDGSLLESGSHTKEDKSSEFKTRAGGREQGRVQDLWDPVRNQSLEFSVLEDHGKGKQAKTIYENPLIGRSNVTFLTTDRNFVKKPRIERCRDPVHSNSSACNQTSQGQSDQNTTFEDFHNTLPISDMRRYKRSNDSDLTEPDIPLGNIFLESLGILRPTGKKRKYPLKVNLILNQRPQYGKVYPVVVTMPRLGKENFVLNLTVDTHDYLIDEVVTTPGAQPSEWRHTYNLNEKLRKWGILMSGLPYNKCFFYQTRATFYNSKHRYVIATVSSLSSRNKLLASVVRLRIRVRNPPNVKCVPMLALNFCKDSRNPLEAWSKGLLIFLATISNNCKAVQYTRVRWDVLDMRGKNLLRHVAVTTTLMLKIPPYEIHELGELLLLRACAKINGVLSVARCYLKIKPPPIEVRIRGNDRRKVDVREIITLDGSRSRDRISKVDTFDTKTFLWSCWSLDDPHNPYCHLHMSSKPIIRLPKNSLKKDYHYNFSLTVTSRRNPLHFNTRSQVLLGVAKPTFTPHIKCRRNCRLRMYASVDSVHLKAQCWDCQEKIVRYEWWVKADDNEFILETQKDYIILHHVEERLIIRLKLTLESRVSAEAIYTLHRNDGPQNGSCLVSPERGMASDTVFKIQCMDFQTPYGPPIYRFRAKDIGIIAQAQSTRLSTRLPETTKLEIIICDYIDMCVTREVNVAIRPYEFKDSKKDQDSIIKEIMVNVTDMVLRGYWNNAFVRCLVATKYMTKTEHGEQIYSSLHNLDVYSKIQLEKLTILARKFLENLTPADYRVAALLASIFKQLSEIFEVVVADNDWLHRDAYNSLTARHMFFMTKMGTASERHSMAMCKPYDPECLNVHLVEHEQRFIINFDPLILLRINNWMMNAWYLYLCVYYLGVLATKRHYPYDQALTVHLKGIAYQVNVTEVTEPVEALTVMTIDKTHELHLSVELLRELSRRLNHTSILLQVISQQSHHNIFWWYPDPMPSKTSVLLFHAASPVAFFKFPDDFELENPIVYRTNITEFNADPGFRRWMSNGSISSRMQVNYYRLMLNSKAMLAVRLVSCSGPMLIKLRLHKRPAPKELRSGACMVSPQMGGKRVWIANFCDRSEAFVSIFRPEDYRSYQIRAGRRLSKRENRGAQKALNYSILLEIFQCNVWTNRSVDPGWSPEFCKTTFERSNGTNVQCTCHTMGSLASRIFPILALPSMDIIPIPVLTVHLALIILLLLLFLLLTCILGLSFGSIAANRRQQNFVQCEAGKIKVKKERNVGFGEEILLVIVTGGHEFAGTTSNIRFYLKSPGQRETSYQITQDPGHPRLLRNTSNKLLVPRGTIRIPTRLALAIERNGRYPSWYCRTVTVVDLERKLQQLFVVESWIERGHTRFMRSKYFTRGAQDSTPHYTWWKRFRHRLEQLHISWFMGNPVSGPWQTGIGGWTMNRLERTSVFVCKAALTITLVSVYFGHSSAEEIEEQRKFGASYYDYEVVGLLSLYAFIIGCLVHVFFEVIILRCLWRKN